MTMKKLLEANTASGRRRISEVFRDFCELSAITFRNSVDRRGWDAREARYLEVMSRYESAEADRFAELLALLAPELEKGSSDVLGELYMSLDLGNERLGQFFTPFDVSTLIAQLGISDYLEKLESLDFITVHEPSVGSGGMIIALADALRQAGINPQRRIHVTAWDIEPTSVHMTYVHLTLLGIPAEIVHGNTLTQERFDVWQTPGHVLGGWSSKLAHRRSTDAAADVIALDADERETPAA